MKLLFASDIHGSAFYCRRLLDIYKESGASRLVLLGDILYHGPRNDLPKEYAPKEVIAMLNPLKNQIYAVRGNCDTEVDQMVLEFPILADYAIFLWRERPFMLPTDTFLIRTIFRLCRKVIFSYTAIPIC